MVVSPINEPHQGAGGAGWEHWGHVGSEAEGQGELCFQGVGVPGPWDIGVLDHYLGWKNIRVFTFLFNKRIIICLLGDNLLDTYSSAC